MLNLIALTGRMTRDPELRTLESGVSVTSFSIAVQRNYKIEGEYPTDFIDCVAWRNTGEFVGKYFTKGRMAVVSGKLQIRGWTDKEGNKRRTAEVLAENVYFADSKTESNNTPAQTGGFVPPAYPAANYAPPASDFAPMDDEDAQLPF